ncbi:MAG: methanogenesis marker protein Mmp4/MtxX [Candidatus Hodarchaeota archaeon]
MKDSQGQGKLKEKKIAIGYNAEISGLMTSLNLLKSAIPIDGVHFFIYRYSNKTNVEDAGNEINMTIIECPAPEEALMNDFNAGKVDGIIRGQLSSSKFLKHLKSTFNIEKLYRLALLASHDNHAFFFAPVGIDEGRDLEEKIHFILQGKALLEKLGVKPKIFILSAGRIDDIGRSSEIKKSIEDAITLVEKIKNIYPNLDIIHGEILIENAIHQEANFILAPDGISGNLIYRTLLHLGNGHSYGAYYLNEGFPGPVIDTSRVGPPEEYFGAMILALRLLVQS